MFPSPSSASTGYKPPPISGAGTNSVPGSVNPQTGFVAQPPSSFLGLAAISKACDPLPAANTQAPKPTGPTQTPIEGDVWEDVTYGHENTVKQDKNGQFWFRDFQDKKIVWQTTTNDWTHESGVPLPKKYRFVRHYEPNLDPDDSESSLSSLDDDSDLDDSDDSAAETVPEPEDEEDGTPRAGDVWIYENDGDNAIEGIQDQFEVEWDGKQQQWFFRDGFDYKVWDKTHTKGPRWIDAASRFECDDTPYVRKQGARW